MEIILKILTLIIFIGILYNNRQRKKYNEWKEKKNQAIYDLGQILAYDREQAKFVIDQLGNTIYSFNAEFEKDKLRGEYKLWKTGRK